MQDYYYMSNYSFDDILIVLITVIFSSIGIYLLTHLVVGTVRRWKDARN